MIRPFRWIIKMFAYRAPVTSPPPPVGAQLVTPKEKTDDALSRRSVIDRRHEILRDFQGDVLEVECLATDILNLRRQYLERPGDGPRNPVDGHRVGDDPDAGAGRQ
jgi:hypothetical protein